MDNRWNITLKAGTTLHEIFKIKEEETKKVVDITGATAICQIRKTTKSPDVLGGPTSIVWT